MSFSSPFTHNGVPLAERSAPVAHVTGSVNSSSTTDGLAVTDAEDELLIEKGAERSSLGAMFRYDMFCLVVIRSEAWHKALS